MNSRTNTLRTLADSYERSAEYRMLAASTQRNTNWTIARLGPLMGKAVDQIQPSDILPILSKMRPGSQAVFISRARALFGFAIKWGSAKTNPLTGVKQPASGEFRPWRQDEVDTFLKGAKPQVGMAVMLAYYTGQRMSDVLAMRWDDIVAGDMHVVQQKTRTPLRIPLHPKLKQALRAHRKLSQGTHIISLRDDSPMPLDTFRKAFRRDSRRMGLPDDMCFHGLRKLTACRLAEKGASTKEIMAVGGWKSLKQVEHYCKGANQRELAARAMEKLEAL